LTLAAIALAIFAGRATLRRRVVFLLGRHGHELAPAVLFCLWICGLLVGEITRSVTGMALVAALVLVAAAVIARRKFAPLRASHRIWTRIDWLIFVHASLILWFIDIWDFPCHHAIVAEYLQGNVPPTALNDPQFPLAYHSIYDALVAIALRGFPIELDLGLALASMACLAVTLANLRSITRTLFRSSTVATLARVLFVWGFGPVFVRYFLERRDFEALHGQSTQVFADIILRRPAALGFAVFTLALALILPCYKAGSGTSESSVRRAGRRLVFLLPACVLLPQIAEEATFFVALFLLPLLIRRRLSWRLVAALGVAGAIGAIRSGVLMSALLGYSAMAVPKPHLSWPPMLPSWNAPEVQDKGVSLLSRAGILFWGTELGPVFLASLVLAALGNARRRLLAAAFLIGALVAVFIQPSGWPKSDLDRFFFYGTPSIFMLSAEIVDRLRGRLGDRRLPAVALTFAVIVCGSPVIWPTQNAARLAESSFQQHELEGNIRRNLKAAGPREPVLTTSNRARDLVMAGFTVLAPFDTHNIALFAGDRFDSYVSKNAQRAVWLFLPERDVRVTGRQVAGRDGGYVLVPARADGNSVTVAR
jgi:hypothetical protein